MPIDFQPMDTSVAPQATSTAPTAAASPSTIDFQPMAAPTTTMDKVASGALAGTGAFVGGALKGAGQSLEALPNLASAAIEKGLNYLADQKIIPDSMAQGFSSGRANIKNAVESVGQKILDFQQAPSAADQAANPTLSAVSNVAGNLAGSTAVASGIIGDLGKGQNAVTRLAKTNAAQGAILGAGSNSDNPIAGAVSGGILGGALGAAAGKLTRSAEIINDKIDDATRIGLQPLSEAGLKSIKGALDSGGKELTTEEVEKAVKVSLQKKLDSVAPEVDITKAPTDMITDMAKANFTDVKNTRNALYAPLNESTAVAETPTLSTALASVTNKGAKALLPDPLPANPTLSDLMTYRKQVSAGINQAERGIKTGASGADFKSLDALNQVKQAVTQDLNNTAAKAGLGDQLAKADAFHAQNYKPFQVYTKSGSLASDADTDKAWSKVNKLLQMRRPNLDAMTQVASTLGPQGKQVFGYAYLQQAMKNAETVDERLSPTKVTQAFNKLQNSGLANHILTPQLQEAFNGMRNIAEGALKTTKGMGGDQKNMIMDFVNNLTHSTAGITLTRALGSTTTPLAKVKNAVSQVLLNAAEQRAPVPAN